MRQKIGGTNHSEKKVLFIVYIFPPLVSPGVWWYLSLARYLSELGWSPIVISADETGRTKDYGLLEQLPQGIEVHRVGYRKLPKALRVPLHVLKLYSPFPDANKYWLSPAYKEAMKLLQREKVDLIFSTAPPYTSHFIAMKLKEEFNTPWVASFEDPWSGNDILDLEYAQTLVKPIRKLQDLRIRRAERSILETADKTIVVSGLHKQHLCEQFGALGDKVEVIPLGYDESGFVAETDNMYTLYPGKLTIAFIGSFYLGWEEIALKLLNVVEELDRDVEMVFIGDSALEMSRVSRANLTCIHYLPKKKALAFASGSDFLLVLTFPSYRSHLPGKIFDYLRLGKPILALVPEDGDAARVIKEAGAGFVLSYEDDELKRQLADIFARWRKGEFANFSPDMDYIKQFERKKTVERFAHIFDEVVRTYSTRGEKK